MLDLASGLSTRGWEPVIACNARTVADEAAALQIRTVIIGTSERAGPLPRRRDVAAFRAIIAEVAPDVVHVNSAPSFSAVAVSGMLARVPVLVHQHILDDEFSRLYSLMHQAAAIVTISDVACAAVARDGYPAHRLHRIPNGVQLRTTGANISVRALIGAAPQEPVVVSVGSLIHRKGHDRTLAALAIALERVPALHLALIGSGPEESALRDVANTLGVAKHVHFLGQRSDIQDLLRTADLFVTGAREEVQPLSVIEAMLCGLPVIASDITAHTEMVEANVTGLLIDADDPRQFGHAVANAAMDAVWRSAARERLIASAPERYSFDRYLERFSNLYTALLSVPRHRYGFPRALRWMPGYTTWLKGAAGRRLTP